MKIPQRKRKVTTITLDPEIVEKAKKYNLNISRLSEDSLKEMIKKLEHEAEPMGAPKVKKGGEKEMTSKLPWAAAVIIIVAAAGLGAWAIWGGAPTAPTPSSPSWNSVLGMPSGSKSGIVNVYIAKTGENYSENWSAVATTDNYYLKQTASGQTGSIPYETSFVFLIEVTGHDDNMAYINTDNLKVELSVTGSFTKAAENTNGGDGTEYQFVLDSTHIGVNAVWDNGGSFFKLPAGGSIDYTTKLWLWA